MRVSVRGPDHGLAGAVGDMEFEDFEGSVVEDGLCGLCGHAWLGI